MSLSWQIRSSDGFEASMPGCLHENEIVRVLQRLVCRNLSQDEIIRASLRQGFRGYSPALEKIGTGVPIHIGENPFYIADRKPFKGN